MPLAGPPAAPSLPLPLPPAAAAAFFKVASRVGCLAFFFEPASSPSPPSSSPSPASAFPRLRLPLVPAALLLLLAVPLLFLPPDPRGSWGYAG